MSADVVVHLPSGPVAAYLAGPNRVDVAGVTLPIVVEGHRAERRLAVLPARRNAHGGTDTVYALVEPYALGALDIQRVRAVQPGSEHEQRGHEHQGQQRQKSRHAAKVRRSDTGKESAR